MAPEKSKTGSNKFVDLGSLIADAPIQTRSARSSLQNTRAGVVCGSGNGTASTSVSSRVSEASSGTRQLVSRYMKGKDVLVEQSSTTEDAIFTAMKDVSYEPFERREKQEDSKIPEKEERTESKKSGSGMLERYLSMLDKSLEHDE